MRFKAACSTDSGFQQTRWLTTQKRESLSKESLFNNGLLNCRVTHGVSEKLVRPLMGFKRFELKKILIKKIIWRVPQRIALKLKTSKCWPDEL